MSEESSQVKLPLFAPTNVSIQPETGNNSMVWIRRGISSFCPTVQSLSNHHHHQRQPNPCPQLPRVQEATPDLDPAQIVTPTSGDMKNPAPPLEAAVAVAAAAATTTTTPNVRYRECRKNHAASTGGHVVDGCREFMPLPESLKCAGCDCHRNFHRKEIQGSNNNKQQKSSRSHPTPPKMVNVDGGAAVELSNDDLNRFGGHAVVGPSNSGSGKRFRTKFSKEQKDRMNDLAEKMEWRMPKEYEQEVQKLCAEVGVKRQAFKVWMHNKKQLAMKKREI